MGFKHTDFSSSEVMRSLERVAYQKGMVKTNTITKTASKQTPSDLTPTASLMGNIVKLCSGLRERGFNQQASELENDFLDYKRAQTLYQVSPEKGEDLIDAAHPKGSHKLEDVDSEEAIFEDIIDQMKKTLQVVEKQPTGKLANLRAIQMVKKIFADDAQKTDFSKYSPEQLEQFISGNVKRAASIVTSIGPMIKNEMTVFYDYTRKQEAVAEASQNTTLDSMQEMVKEIGDLKTRIKPGSWVTLGLGGITENTWATVEPMLDGATRLVNAAIQARIYINAQHGTAITKNIDENAELPKEKPVAPPKMPGSTPTGNIPVDNLIRNYGTLIGRINRDVARVQARDLPNATALVTWLNRVRDSFAQPFLQEYTSSQFKDDPDVLNSYTTKLNALNSKMDAFEQKWLTA